MDPQFDLWMQPWLETQELDLMLASRFGVLNFTWNVVRRARHALRLSNPEGSMKDLPQARKCHLSFLHLCNAQDAFLQISAQLA